MIKRIRNNTSIEQSVFVNNRRIILEPHAEKDFEDSVAEHFLSVCDGLVEEVIDAPEPGAIHDDEVDTGIVWLANMTGDPDAPKTVRRKKRLPRGEFEWVDDPNPLAEAMDVVREHDMGMKEYETQDGLLADNLGKREVRIPKYGRKPFPRDLANWMLQRDANAGWISPHHRGRIIVSRPKSSFEPDMNWALDDMRAYLRMMDRNVDVGPSEAKVRANAEVTHNDVNDAVREAKTLCMKRLHKRVANPQYRLYSKSEFEEFRREFEKPEPVPQATETVEVPPVVAASAAPKPSRSSARV
jgi:hypothetical protein